MNTMRFETWSEVDADGRTSTTVTDAPIGVQLVHADAYDKLLAENERLRDALERLLRVASVELGNTRPDVLDHARAAIEEKT